jgi:tetratricopeptide (TPR) repeat protein
MIVTAYRICLFACAVFASSPALAGWHEASSDHFVIYADDKPANLQRYAENLERYHAAMAFLLGREIEKPSPSNRVAIYAVGSQRDVRNLANGDSRYVAGFYIPRASGSTAFVQDLSRSDGDGYPSFSTIVLLHEYAHHFLMASSDFAMPRWLNEGSAEFFAAASFRKDGGVMIGRPALHRGGSILYGEKLTVRDLFADESKAAQRLDGSFYGYSWLLVHYLTFREERAGQVAQYQRNLIAGMNAVEAGEAAFGDLRALDKELGTYARTARMNSFVLPPEKLAIGTVTIRALPQGEAEMMPVIIRSKRGVDREAAQELVIEARKIASRHPDDPGVLSALAEAEHDAGNDEAAIEAANRAIAADPKNANAYVHKGKAMFRQAQTSDDTTAALTAAMTPFTQLNSIENDHPMPLIYYYQSYVGRGARPSENAQAALIRASQLAPFDLGLKMQVAKMALGEGEIDTARAFLQPVAINPHNEKIAANAAQLIALLEQVPDGTRIDVSRLGVAEFGGGQTGSDDGEDGDGA